jgi:hypothetical protein
VDQIHTVVAWIEAHTPPTWDDPSPDASKHREEAHAAIKRRWRHLGKQLGVEPPKEDVDEQIADFAAMFGFDLRKTPKP